MTNNIYLIPKSFPCEICGSKIEVTIPHGTDKFESFKCSQCGFEQRMTYYGKYFGVIKDVK